MLVLALSLFAAASTTSILAQEFTPSVEDRVQSEVSADALTVQDDQKRAGLQLGVIVSAAYNSNIFLSASKPESDIVYRVGPSIAYTKGDPVTGSGAFIQFAYRPSAVTYTDHRSDNRIDQQAALVAGWHGKVTTLTYKGAIQKLGDATADTGSQTDRIEFENELRLAWSPREKVTLELAAGNSHTDYVDPAYYDSSKIYGDAAVRYAYSPKTQLSIAYQLARYQVEGASDQIANRLTGKIEWQPREKIGVSLELGAEHRKTESGSQVNPVVEGRIEWTPRKGTDLYLAGYQKVESSAYYSGQNYTVKGVSAGVSQRLGGNWTGRLEGGLENSSYSSVSGSSVSGRDDRIWFIRPAIEYKISDTFNIAVFYRASDNRSNRPDFGYQQDMVGLEANYQF